MWQRQSDSASISRILSRYNQKALAPLVKSLKLRFRGQRITAVCARWVWLQALHQAASHPPSQPASQRARKQASSGQSALLLLSEGTSLHTTSNQRYCHSFRKYYRPFSTVTLPEPDFSPIPVTWRQSYSSLVLFALLSKVLLCRIGALPWHCSVSTNHTSAFPH